MNQIERLAHRLLNVACTSSLQHQHAAIVIRKGKIVAKSASNQFKPYTFGAFEGTRHAEISAICNFLGKKESWVLHDFERKKREKKAFNP